MKWSEHSCLPSHIVGQELAPLESLRVVKRELHMMHALTALSDFLESTSPLIAFWSGLQNKPCQQLSSKIPPILGGFGSKWSYCWYYKPCAPVQQSADIIMTGQLDIWWNLQLLEHWHQINIKKKQVWPKQSWTFWSQKKCATPAGFATVSQLLCCQLPTTFLHGMSWNKHKQVLKSSRWRRS